MRSIGVLATLIAFNSCANVTFHNDAALKNKTGLKFCNSKPYLLVTYTGSKDNPIKTEILSPGLGKSGLRRLPPWLGFS